MKIYFAHPISIYNTIKEFALLGVIKLLFKDCVITNPNSVYNESKYIIHGMDFYFSLIDDCDTVVFIPFDDGYVSAGVTKEVLYGKRKGKIIYRVNPYDFSIQKIANISKTLTVEETRERLKAIEQLNINLKMDL